MVFKCCGLLRTSLRSREVIIISWEDIILRLWCWQGSLTGGCIMIKYLVWIRNQLDVTFVLSFISPLQVAQHVLYNHVPILRSWWLCSVIATCWYCAVTIPLIVTAQYQHVAITLHSRQLLKIGTWLHETCWATCKGKIKITQKWHLVGFLSTLNYDAWSTTYQIKYLFVSSA